MENTGLSSGKVLSEECPQHKPKMADSLAFKSCILFFELKYILFTLSLFISWVGSRFSVSQKTEQEGSHLPLAPPVQTHINKKRWLISVDTKTHLVGRHLVWPTVLG